MRRPVRFFNYEIAHDGSIWIEDGCEILSAKYSHDGTSFGGRWRIVVVEYGAPQEALGIDGYESGRMGP